MPLTRQEIRKRFNDRHPNYLRDWKREHTGQLANRKKITRDKHRTMAMSELGGQCADCSINDERVLVFDHVPGETKVRNVASLFGGAWSKVAAEIAKCDLVCANCHAIRTRERLNK